MLKKLMVAVLALVMGGAVAEAKDLVQIDLTLYGSGIIRPAGKLPKGTFRTEPQKTKSGGVSFPYYIILDETRSAELKLEVSGGSGKLSAALCPFSKKGKERGVISVECSNFEICGEQNPLVPCTISKWTRMTMREVKDGDIIVIKLEFGEPMR